MIELSWKNEKLRCEAKVGEFRVDMDAKPPFSDGKAPTPKELLLSAICGCTAMDVISLLKKTKKPLRGLKVSATADPQAGRPPIYSRIDLKYELAGEFESQAVTEAVRMSQSELCGVSAMVAKSVPIYYQVWLNEKQIGEGQSSFS